MSSIFRPEVYEEFRPRYPKEVFIPLILELDRRQFSNPLKVLDLGCGTGLSSVSFTQLMNDQLKNTEISLTLVDSDSGMLEVAVNQPSLRSILERGIHSKAEDLELSCKSIDLILVGSALHWMDIPRLARKTALWLSNPGLLQVFEYQFPKCHTLSELNEWIRKQFNLLWKAPHQKPRGTLQELIRGFTLEGYEVISSSPVPMMLSLAPEELAGFLYSQSRFIHFENSLSPENQVVYRNEVLNRLREFYKNESTANFDFKLQYFLFARSLAHSSMG